MGVPECYVLGSSDILVKRRYYQAVFYCLFNCIMDFSLDIFHLVMLFVYLPHLCPQWEPWGGVTPLSSISVSSQQTSEVGYSERV